VHVSQQVVAVLDAHPRHGVAGRPREIHPRGRFEQLTVVDERPTQVAHGQVHEVEPLAELHPGRVVRGADEVSTVVHVDVQVAAVPAPRRRVEQPSRIVLNDEPLARGGRYLELRTLELQSPGADHAQRLRRHRDGHVAAVEERPVMGVPFRQDAVREPGAADGVGDRPTRGAGRQESQLGCRRRSERPSDAQGILPQRNVEGRIGAVEIHRLDGSPARAHAYLPPGDGEAEIGVRRRVHNHVYRHGAPRYRRPGGTNLGAQHPLLADANHDDTGRDFVSDHRADCASPVAGLRHRLEDRAQHGEAGPPEEVRELLFAPVPPMLTHESAVASQRLDHLRRQVKRPGLLAAHGASSVRRVWQPPRAGPRLCPHALVQPTINQRTVL
jgi:hypothetical protein